MFTPLFERKFKANYIILNERSKSVNTHGNKTSARLIEVDHDLEIISNYRFAAATYGLLIESDAAAEASAPHFLFGSGPIRRTSFPPAVISSCPSHGFSSEEPFSAAD